MKLELTERNYGIPDQELIDDMVAVAKMLGKNILTAGEYQEHGKYCDSTIKKRFRTWFAALKRAGLQPSRPPMETDKILLFENLGNVWAQLGEQPKFKHISAPLSRYPGSTYLRHFDTWMDALKAFVEYENSKPPGNPQMEERLKAFRDMSKNYQKRPGRRRTPSPGLRFSVFLRDGFRCTACGASPLTEPGVKLHCDHIDPWSKGGETVMKNLRTLCSTCNLGKSSKECDNPDKNGDEL